MHLLLELEGRRYKKGAGREGLAVEGVFAALAVVGVEKTGKPRAAAEGRYL